MKLQHFLSRLWSHSLLLSMTICKSEFLQTTFWEPTFTGQMARFPQIPQTSQNTLKAPLSLTRWSSHSAVFALISPSVLTTPLQLNIQLCKTYSESLWAYKAQQQYHTTIIEFYYKLTLKNYDEFVIKSIFLQSPHATERRTILTCFVTWPWM